MHNCVRPLAAQFSIRVDVSGTISETLDFDNVVLHSTEPPDCAIQLELFFFCEPALAKGEIDFLAEHKPITAQATEDLVHPLIRFIQGALRLLCRGSSGISAPRGLGCFFDGSAGNLQG